MNVNSIGKGREGKTTPGNFSVLGALAVLGKGFVKGGVTPFGTKIKPKVFTLEFDRYVPPSKMMIIEILPEGSQIDERR